MSGKVRIALQRAQTALIIQSSSYAYCSSILPPLGIVRCSLRGLANVEGHIVPLLSPSKGVEGDANGAKSKKAKSLL